MTSGDVSTHTLSLLSLFWSVWVQGLFLYLFILEHFGSGNFSLLIYFGALWSRCFPFALDMATCSVSFVLHQCHTQKYILTNSIFHTHNWQHSQQFGGFKLIASFTKSSIFLFNMSSSKLFSVSAHSILISISFTHLVISSTSQIKRMRGFSQPVVSGTICLSKCVIIKKHSHFSYVWFRYVIWVTAKDSLQFSFMHMTLTSSLWFFAHQKISKCFSSNQRTSLIPVLHRLKLLNYASMHNQSSLTFKQHIRS